MKNRRIEAILATAIYVFILIVVWANSMRNADSIQLFAQMAIPTFIYLAFVAFTQGISPFCFRKKRIELGIVLTLALFFVTWFALAACVWANRYPRHEVPFSQSDFLGEALGIVCVFFLLLFAYEGIKRGIRYLKLHRNNLTRRIGQESLVVFGIGALVFLLLMVLAPELAALWMVAVPYAYILFALITYWLIPHMERRQHGVDKFILVTLPLSFVLFIPFGVLFMSMMGSRGVIFFLVWMCIAIIILPLSWYVFQQQRQRIAQLVDLKKELGQTSADLKHLRSQINPHFLFNILNTLYGTALQEGASRTADSIQKLGDMMRFMLHENHQDSILLAREIAYLRNYIDLQLLRTATTPEVTVDCDITDVLEGVYIAPMLLIPFVENAFKHGISLQEKSWIKISLKESEGQLHFDAYNSIHRGAASDPERNHSGIGLENVRQRLELLYPGIYDLVIRETTREFFVHLTIKL
ncbi:sensor histidine kinase [Olivibacter sitiensis]|uniref:sensor histidine kinase n=1 Tax=Olivibacter sitiensis TaxID=376470 RepID=UPI000423FD7F|nr:histidine kinase [Olivibacter sitiensis]